MWNLKIPNAGQIELVIIDWQVNCDWLLYCNMFTIVKITWTVLWYIELYGYIVKVPIQ